MEDLLLWSSVVLGAYFIVLCRLYRKRHIVSAPPRFDADFRAGVRLLIVMGSGGHTKEMISLLQFLSPIYKHRTYLIASTDKLSMRKVMAFEEERHSGGAFRVIQIFRCREVMQSYVSSVLTTFRALLEAFPVVWKARPDALLCNGPGTCVPVCVVAALFDLLRLRDTRIFYVESVCRVRELSASALILYYMRIPDLIAVHWQNIAAKYPRTEYIDSL